ncbi:hypothetical protein SAMN05444396_104357 [Flavobacterium segetis]|uniref:Uncharacterized protein n=1 Tax=Flavobacterium segetis TaxID=271157 RepID=A0A1M5H481_9FLAO|nr:hypothetical protein [Flavobacterium segetis]SHG10696.1 hypothetical protein SAMN05444396_104357 [Flavobacterium segetis]
MIDLVTGDMEIKSTLFFGLPLFWWFSILIFAGIVLAAAHLYKRKK